MTLQVLGAGFGRTGTNSLKHALEVLGFAPCHHMMELRNNPTQLALWTAVAAGERPEWDTLFAGYRAQVDWPGLHLWRELAEAYPNAPMILTLRDPEAWHDSVQKTILPFMQGRDTHPYEDMRLRAHMQWSMIVEQWFGGHLDDKDKAIAVFEAHYAEVRKTIPPERLLEYRVSDGWEPLCAFLKCPVPDIPFPHTNSRDDFDPLAAAKRAFGDAPS